MNHLIEDINHIHEEIKRLVEVLPHIDPAVIICDPTYGLEDVIKLSIKENEALMKLDELLSKLAILKNIKARIHKPPLHLLQDSRSTHRFISTSSSRTRI